MRFKPAKMPNAAAPALSQIIIDDFLGCDLTNSPENVDTRRSPDCINMVRSTPGKVRKRMGWYSRFSTKLPGAIHGYHTLKDKPPIVHAGRQYYKMVQGYPPELVLARASDNKSVSWEFRGETYILDGENYYRYDGDHFFSITSDSNPTIPQERPYVPTKTIGRAPSGGGTPYEALNLLTPRYKELFLGTENDTIYQMTYAPIDQTYHTIVEQLQEDGTWKTLHASTDYSVNADAGQVIFTSPPGVSPISGQDNIRITACHEVAGYKERIAHCRFGTLFGVAGATDRLFFSGNPEYPNYDWFSGLNDPLYWPDINYSVLGQANSAIVGYSIISNHLATFKDDEEDGRNVIIREGVLLDGKPAFRIINMLQGQGAIAPYSFNYLSNEPLFLTNLGVYAITPQDVTGEKISQLRSFYLNGKLLKEPGLENAVSYVYKDFYMLAINGKLYILDGLQSRAVKNTPYSTRQYSAFLCDNIPATTFWEENGTLCFGTASGDICEFYTNPDAIESYNDNGAAITARWCTPDIRGRTFYRNKTFGRFYAELSAAAATGASAWGKVGGIWEEMWEELWTDYETARYFSYQDVMYSRFSYSNDRTPKTLGGKIRLKKLDKAEFKIENTEVNEPFGINAIGIEFVETGYYRP